MNAKQELLHRLEEPCARLLCAYIQYGADWEEPRTLITLKVGYDSEELESFLNKLNFDYDSGFGTQELFGVVWLEDGTWLSRGEYDGSEWWHQNKLPHIPIECLRVQ